MARPQIGIRGLLREAARDWMEDDAPRLGAALAYYTAFSIAPLLVIVIAIAGLVVGEEAARGQLVDEIGRLMGTDAGRQIEQMIASARQTDGSILGTTLGIVTLLLGASGVFGELQAALNRVWDVEAGPSAGVLDTVRRRFFSITLVLGTGFLLLVSLVMSALLARVSALIAGSMPGMAIVAPAIDFAVSLAGVTILFALLFKFLPDVEVAWRDVWAGAFLTALLFAAGKLLIGLYLGRIGVASGFGAAGSLVVLLVWVYYSAQIMLFGAEFTQVWAARRGAVVKPVAGARSGVADPGGLAQIQRYERESSIR